MEKVWLDKHKYEEAERRLYETQSFCGNTGSRKQKTSCSQDTKGGKKGRRLDVEDSKSEEVKAKSQSCIVSEIVRCREQILLSLNGFEAGDTSGNLLHNRLDKLESENKSLKNLVNELQSTVRKLGSRVSSLEESNRGKQSQVTADKSVKQLPGVQNGAPKAEANDDDLDLFGSDEDEAANELREQRLKAYEAKKSKKPEVIAKSSVVLEVKPWDDETDLAEMENLVRSIVMDGLVWGVSKLVPVAYNVKKLQIVCVVEDDKVSIEELSEKIEQFEDFVQSVDIASFNKI